MEDSWSQSADQKGGSEGSYEENEEWKGGWSRRPTCQGGDVYEGEQGTF